MLLCGFQVYFCHRSIVSPKTKRYGGFYVNTKVKSTAKCSPAKQTQPGVVKTINPIRDLQKRLNYSLNQLEGLNLNCDWFQYIYIIVIMGFVSYLSFARLLPSLRFIS